MNIEYLEELNNFNTDSVQPDLTFILDIDPEKAALRMSSLALDRMESTGIEFYLRVQEGYHEIAHRFPMRCVLIDGSHPESEVFELIMKVVNKKLLKEMSCS